MLDLGYLKQLDLLMLNIDSNSYFELVTYLNIHDVKQLDLLMLDLGFHIHPIIRAKAIYIDSTIKNLVTLAQKVLSLGRGEDSRLLEEHKWVSLNSSLVVILD